MKRNTFLFLPLFCIVLMLGCAQEEQPFPSNQISLIVPWDAGGGTDALARSLAEQASDEFGVAVNVVNRHDGYLRTG